jgi:hypothetical protein
MVDLELEWGFVAIVEIEEFVVYVDVGVWVSVPVLEDDGIFADLEPFVDHVVFALGEFLLLTVYLKRLVFLRTFELRL